MEKVAIIRLSFFLGIFLVMALWEIIAPRRKKTTSKAIRWTWNLGLTILNPLVVRLLFPVLAVAIAIKAREQGWGLLNLYDLPDWVSFILSIILLDMVVYLQHLMFHAVPLLWRLHMVHHADLDYDVTTGLRFHPIEIIISMLIKMSTVAVLGPPVSAVVAFEVILNGMAMFNHGNVHLPAGIDRLLRWIVVTPDMHRVHHSVIPNETNSNFGAVFPIWDILFGTFRTSTRQPHESMELGLEGVPEERTTALRWLLTSPFQPSDNKTSSTLSRPTVSTL